MSNTTTFNNTLAFHPGYYVKQMMEDMEINQNELAKRLDTTPKTVSELINGNISMSGDIAIKLAAMFGTSLELWLNLNKSYYEKKLEIERKQKEKAECEIIKHIDYGYWVKMNMVPVSDKCADKVRNMHKYFNIASLSLLEKPDFLVQYRSCNKAWDSKKLINANAWVQTVINAGKDKHSLKYNDTKLKNSISDIRVMAKRAPNLAVRELEFLLGSCGVAFVVTPNLKNANVTGAVKWLKDEKAIMGINDRMKYADVFWFSVFHELRHVMQRRLKSVIINFEDNEYEKDPSFIKMEREADEFAKEKLIPSKRYNEFINENKFDEYSIKSFASDIQSHPGIVVGRLQKEGYVPYDKFNYLKIKYEFSFKDYTGK
jgi:addiction module HigA family antidote